MVNPKKVEKFGRWALKRRAEVEEREKNPKDPRFDTPPTSAHGYFMATLYQKGRDKIAAKAVDEIKAIAKSLGQSASGRKEEIAHEWLLRAYYAALGPVEDSTISKCRRLGIQMHYAHLNNIEPEQLMAFLYVSGRVSRIQRLLKASHPDLFLRRKMRRPKRPTARERAREKREMAKRQAKAMETLG